MARNYRSNKSPKSTSFGKKSDAEKAFRKKNKGKRGDEESYSNRAQGFSRPSRPGSGSFDRGENKPFRKKEGGSFSERPKSSSPFRKKEDRFDRGEKKPFQQREGDSFREKPQSISPKGSFRAKSPFHKRDDRFDRGDKRPFRRKEEDSDKPKSFSPKESFRPKSPFRKREDRFERGDKRPLRGKEEDSDKPKSFSPKESFRPKSPFRKREDRAEGQERKSYRGREQKSFVRSRVEKQRKQLQSDAPEKKEDDGLIRLNKFISNSGVCSRREADELISMGLVTVNGKTITEMGHKVKITDDVRYEGKKLKAEKPVYILMNKPKGFITTTDDPQERNTVMNIIAGACKERVYPVGRLDRNTTGLLLLTNDGELADKLTHPSYNVKKIYKVELDRPLSKADFQKIQEGVHLEEGRAVPDDLAIVSDDGKTVGIELHIGWNRIVRRIFEMFSYEVIKLDRVVYAGLDKRDLKRGQWRFLKQEEIIRLKHYK